MMSKAARRTKTQMRVMNRGNLRKRHHSLISASRRMAARSNKTIKEDIVGNVFILLKIITFVRAAGPGGRRRKF